MENASHYRDDPRRLEAAELLGTLFSSAPRPAAEILTIARKLEGHDGVGFFKLPVPYFIKSNGIVLKSGLNSMRGAVSSLIADLEAMDPAALVVVDIDASALGGGLAPEEPVPPDSRPDASS